MATRMSDDRLEVEAERTKQTMTGEQLNQLKAFELLTTLAGERMKEDDIKFEGTTFLIPASLANLKSAAKFLLERAEDEESQTNFGRVFKFRPMDGAHATVLAIREAFGFSISKPTYTMFGPNPPQMLDVPIGVNETAQVPWGNLALPGLADTILTLNATRDKELGVVFACNVTGPRKYRAIIEGLFVLIERKLQTMSIYRGKAIDGAEQPNFVDTSSVNPDDVVYAQEVMQQLEANVWSPIKHAAQLEALGQPGKRSVLFEGPYGTGKTLAALLTAKVAVSNGWTFLMCRPSTDDLMLTMQTARIYQPAVVFFEDLDTVGAATGTVDEVSRILDAFDGMNTKGLKMLLVLTTNHRDRIHKGMLRPGRLDAVIHIGSMDRAGVEKLVKRVVRDNLANDVDFDRVFEAMGGFMPAFVREAIDRSVRFSVSRNNGTLGQIDTEDLVLAATGLRPQLELMDGAVDTVPKSSIEAGIARVVSSTMDQSAVVDSDGDQMYHIKVVDPMVPGSNGSR